MNTSEAAEEQPVLFNEDIIRPIAFPAVPPTPRQIQRVISDMDYIDPFNAIPPPLCPAPDDPAVTAVHEEILRVFNGEVARLRAEYILANGAPPNPVNFLGHSSENPPAEHWRRFASPPPSTVPEPLFPGRPPTLMRVAENPAPVMSTKEIQDLARLQHVKMLLSSALDSAQEADLMAQQQETLKICDMLEVKIKSINEEIEKKILGQYDNH